MTVAELATDVLIERFRAGTVIFQVGPLLVRIKATNRLFIDTFRLMYARSAIFSPDATVADSYLVHTQLDKQTYEWTIDGATSDRPHDPQVTFAHFEWALHVAMAPALLPSVSVHASVAAREDGRAIVMVGKSGSGKSTLLAGLLTNGWRMVADEFLVLRLDGGIDPVPSLITLKNTSIELIRARAGDIVFGPTTIDPDRGPVAHIAPQQFVTDGSTLKIAAIAFPYFTADAEPMIVPFSSGEAVIRLAEQSHNYHVAGVNGFRRLLQLAQAPAYAVRYSSLDEGFKAVDFLMDEAK